MEENIYGETENLDATEEKKLDPDYAANLERKFNEEQEQTNDKKIENIYEETENLDAAKAKSKDSFNGPITMQRADNIYNIIIKATGITTAKDKGKVKELKDFFRRIANIERDIKIISATMHGSEYLFKQEEITEAIKKVSKDFEKIQNDLNKLIPDIRAIRNHCEGKEILDKTIEEVDAWITSISDQIKELKKRQINDYNIYIDSLTEELENFKKDNQNYANEIDELLGRMPKKYDKIGDYLSTIQGNYIIIYGISKELASIKASLSKKTIPEEKEKIDNQIEAEIRKIVDEIQEIAYEIAPKEEITEEEKSQYQLRIDNIEYDIAILSTRIETNKNNISSEEKYKEFQTRIDNISGLIVQINNDLDKLKIKEISETEKEENSNEYKKLKLLLRDIEQKLEGISSLINSYKNMEILPENKDRLIETAKGLLENYSKEIKDIEGRIDPKTVTKEQLENLNKKVKDLNGKIETNRNILNTIREKNVSQCQDEYAIIEAAITKIFERIDDLSNHVQSQIDKLDDNNSKIKKPIKKTERKYIDGEIASIQTDLNAYEAMLNNVKEKDPEKDKQLRDRISEARTNLKKVQDKYNERCPLTVRTARAAKNFFKKHPKIVLIAAGLATMAIVHATIGPILIPALIQGNIMLGACVPALKGVTSGIISVLAKIIGATNVNGIIVAANGVTLNPTVAATSLLRAIGITGLSSAGIVVPHVLAIKALTNKMAKKDKKIKEQEEKTKEEEHKDEEEELENNPEEKEKPKNKKDNQKHEKRVAKRVAKIDKRIAELQQLKEDVKRGTTLQQPSPTEITEEENEAYYRGKTTEETAENYGGKTR